MKGIIASPGIAIGKAFVLKEHEITIDRNPCKNSEMELVKFNDAIEITRLQLKSVIEKSIERIGMEKAQVFEAHIMMLEDPSLHSGVSGRVTNENLKIEAALIDTVVGCRFADRCPHAFDVCRQQQPELFKIGNGQRARCWLKRHPDRRKPSV